MLLCLSAKLEGILISQKISGGWVQTPYQMRSIECARLVAALTHGHQSPLVTQHTVLITAIVRGNVLHDVTPRTTTLQHLHWYTND